MTQIINGKEMSIKIKDEVRLAVENLKENGVHPHLVVIQVGNDSASSTYVRNKRIACDCIGINSFTYNLDETTTESELLALIYGLNLNEAVHGILVQLPLPKHIDEKKVLRSIAPEKDVDGFHPETVGKMFIGEECLLPCTPAGIIELLKRYEIEIEGKECVVVGRSNIVGKPMAMLLLRENGTVTIAHSKTKDLHEITKRADILVVAIGKPKFVNSEYVKDGAVVVDVGIHKQENGKLCGDVDFDDVFDKVRYITPVPGGVGPMTIAMLMKNCLEAAKMNEE